MNIVSQQAKMVQAVPQNLRFNTYVPGTSTKEWLRTPPLPEDFRVWKVIFEGPTASFQVKEFDDRLLLCTQLQFRICPNLSLTACTLEDTEAIPVSSFG